MDFIGEEVEFPEITIRLAGMSVMLNETSVTLRTIEAIEEDGSFYTECFVDGYTRKADKITYTISDFVELPYKKVMATYKVIKTKSCHSIINHLNVFYFYFYLSDQKGLEKLQKSKIKNYYLIFEGRGQSASIKLIKTKSLFKTLTDEANHRGRAQTAKITIHDKILYLEECDY